MGRDRKREAKRQAEAATTEAATTEAATTEAATTEATPPTIEATATLAAAATTDQNDTGGVADEKIRLDARSRLARRKIGSPPTPQDGLALERNPRTRRIRRKSTRGPKKDEDEKVEEKVDEKWVDEKADGKIVTLVAAGITPAMLQHDSMSVSEHHGIPGAFAIGGSDDPELADVEPSYLVSATTVDDSPLAKATMLDKSAEKRAKRGMRFFMILSAILLLAMGIIIPVTIVLTRRSSENSVPTLQPTLSLVPSTAPSVPPPTPAPSESPSSSPTSQLFGLLASNSLDGGEALLDPSSVQTKAMLWLIRDMDTRNVAYSDGRILQRYALATLYFATLGEQWANRSGWDQSLEGVMFAIPELFDECNWAGVFCREDGSVRRLALFRNDMVGELPNELGLLRGLRNMDFRRNGLIGTIPLGVKMLTGLEFLDVSSNTLAGGLDSEIGLLLALRELNVSNNLVFEGTLPSEIGNLVNLETLILSDGQLGGGLPTEISSLTALRNMNLGGNEFIGTLVTELGRLTSLVRLRLRKNMFSGPFPTEIGLLTNLVTFSVFDNRFTGTIPSEFGRLTKLDTLVIPSDTDVTDANNFSGSIPEEVCNAGYALELGCYDRDQLMCDCPVCPPPVCS